MSDDSADALFPERFIPGEMHGLIEAEHLARYRWAGNCAIGRRALDAGCGLGYGSLLLRAAGAVTVTGVDISPEAVGEACEYAAEGVRFVVGDISALALPDASFEVAVCFEAIEHVHEQARALDELRRVLTPDGLLIISSPNRDVYQEGNPHHTHEYTPEELRSALGERFANVRLERQQAWLASILCDDATLGRDDPAQPIDVEVRKVAALRAGRETFTIALASDNELPHPRSLAIVTDLGELDAWRDRSRSAEQHLGRAQRAAHEANDAYRSASAAHVSIQKAYENALEARENALQAQERSESELARNQQSLDRVNTLLAERNAALRLTAEELAALRAQTVELETALDASVTSLAQLRASLSWRATGPLRAFRRGRRDA
jgi:O-antigen biosynthesis protein